MNTNNSSTMSESQSALLDELIYGVNPITRQKLLPGYQAASSDVCDAVIDDAHESFEEYLSKTPNQIAEFLNSIASELNDVSERLIERAHLETALPRPRLQGELTRTIGQLNMFARVVETGTWIGAHIDTAIPDRVPTPKPDIRRIMIPIGPILVFSASNFPLAFSVAGGDTASALAAGNTVVVKAHPAHPGTSELAMSAIRAAMLKCKMPEATVNLVHTEKIDTIRHLVTHPKIRAVGFTGSLAAGKSICNMATTRPDPISVFAEMGSINPVIMLQDILKTSAHALSEKYVQSMTLGVGQFCTKPGVLFLLKSETATNFIEMLSGRVRQVAPGTMLYAGLGDRYEAGIRKLENSGSVKLIAHSQTPANSERGEVAAALLQTNATDFIANKQAREELFGPSSIIVVCDNMAEMIQAINTLDGQLTATIHGTQDDLEKNRQLLELLCQKAGRILVNGFPTGVEVCTSMVHGGPYPASSDTRITAIGAVAMERWLRPVCFQDWPESLLPLALQNKNTLGIWRTINGTLTKESIQ